ncbi:MAG: potassium transporter TrkG [bacterium]
MTNFRTILYYIGRIISAFSFVAFIPFVIAIIMAEYKSAIDLLIGFSSSVLFGYILILLGKKGEITWVVGMVIVSLTWFFLMFLVAIPLFLSGHYLSYLDACFDTMSGLATVGFSIINDIDHLSYSLNTFRFFVPYIAGQGIILVALIFLATSPSGYGMYLGEGREDRILPNIASTAQIIWSIALLYLVVGIGILWLIGIKEDMGIINAFFHAMWLYMSGWATCGLPPTSSSVLFYYSPLIDLATIIVFILGSINFYLHYTIWTGKRLEIFKNTEIRTFFFTLIVSFIFVSLGIVKSGLYNDFPSFFLQGLYHTTSAHTTCGLSFVYPSYFIKWGEIALIGMIIAMGIGGSAGSTGGGIKILRVGVIVKSLIEDIKSIAFPSSAVVHSKFHHIKDILLNDRIIRSSMIITFSYLSTYFFGALIGVIYGYPFINSLFESVSTTSGTGFSCGIVSSSMPSLMKIVYIFQMWAGRLEFISIFAIISLLLGRKR